ncbi:hypothetical protein [Pseudomonas frederiksbergensis]|jgi:uncharacterized delta-60 repeat protein|uniref:hypothetical protein n=1 Tax=Pseudomonas frederiksbergensis TaxID=104087 RepID=UPI003D245870
MTSQKTHSSLVSGQLDPNFGDNGLVSLRSPNPNYPEYISLVVGVGPDNKTYVAGQAYDGLNYTLYTLARLTENGSIDTTFGKEGYFYDWFHGSDRSQFYAEQIAFVKGKILVSGRLFHYVENVLRFDKAVVRFLLDGSIDKSFGENGKFIFHVPKENADGLATTDESHLEAAQSIRNDVRQPSKLQSYASDTLPTTDDHILLLHSSGTFDTIDGFIIRITHEGNLDRTFNGSGFVRVSHAKYPFLELYSLTIDKDGNYLSGGEVRSGYQDSPDAIVLVKHNKDGKLDTNFQHDGFLLMQDEEPTHYFTLARTVKQPNNRILCMGSRIDRNDYKASGLLISLEADGSSNIQFNSGKPVFTTINSSTTFWFNTDFQPDGSFLVTGLLDIEISRGTHYAVSRFLYNGILDKNYGDGGWVAYTEAKIFSYETSTIKNNKIVFSVEKDNNGKVSRAIGRGLML